MDARGGPVIDPTDNVLRIVEVQGAHLREIMALDRAHAAVIRELETKRLDAIRAVDVQAVQRAAEVQAQVATTLQGQVADTAEAMRNQLGVLGQSFTDGLAGAIKPLADALALVQQQQNIQAGQRVQITEARDNRSEARDTRGEGRNYVATLIAALALVAALVVPILTR